MLDSFYVSACQRQEHLAKIAKQGVKPMCSKGCHACCLNPTVPIIQPELMAISWYSSEVLEGEVRKQVKHQLETHKERTSCPFLVDGTCSIYPVRPLSCRDFMVKNKICEAGEDIWTTRRQDIIPLSRETVARPVMMRMLDLYEFKSVAAKRRAFEGGAIMAQARPMHKIPWTEIATTMTIFETGGGVA